MLSATTESQTLKFLLIELLRSKIPDSFYDNNLWDMCKFRCPFPLYIFNIATMTRVFKSITILPHFWAKPEIRLKFAISVARYF